MPMGGAAMSAAHPDRLPSNVLTDRERDVIERFERGETFKEIGRALGISHKTASTYACNARMKRACGRAA